MQENLFAALDQYEAEMIRLRRDFHRHPELSFQEVRTPAKIIAFYEALGIPYREQVGGSGIVATLKGTRPGKTIAVRADFDALPLQEETDLSFRSIRPGVMHACGHDGHTAIVLGLAAAFKPLQEELEGTIVFIHQHGEEVFPGGAIQMIEDGCLDGVDAIFGTHLENDLPVGTIGYHSGHTLCAIDEFEIVVHGQGGHAQAPHRTQDALVAGAQLVCNLQHLVSRRVDPFEPAVVAIGSFHSGRHRTSSPAKPGSSVKSGRSTSNSGISYANRSISLPERRVLELALHIRLISRPVTRRSGIIRMRRSWSKKRLRFYRRHRSVKSNR